HIGQLNRYCPMCHRMNTGISRKTNLARCFDCKKNYNTIDLVKEIMGLGFLESAAYLEKIKEQMSAETHQKYPPEKMTRQKDMVHIGDVFKSLASSSPEKASSSRALRQESQAISDLQKRVCDLEICIKSLSEKIAFLERQ
ncbi:MAG: DNA primase, partial [Desulfobacteraceae bacterium]